MKWHFKTVSLDPAVLSGSLSGAASSWGSSIRGADGGALYASPGAGASILGACMGGPLRASLGAICRVLNAASASGSVSDEQGKAE
jgi:hypothetical protein